jgi:type IV pilus assembly protein PilN
MSSIQHDFLREKRETQGLPSMAQLLPYRGALIRLGSLIGGSLLLGVVGLTGLISFQHEANKVNAEKVYATNRQLKSNRALAEQEELRFTQINAGNRKRASDLATLRSSAALLSELQLRTPEKVQIRSVQLSDTALQVKGVAVEPLAFSRINALQLSLKESPLLAKDISLTKVERVPEIIKPLPVKKGEKVAVDAIVIPTTVSFELNAPLAILPPEQKAAVLRVLGAEGMAGRLELLNREGLLK